MSFSSWMTELRAHEQRHHERPASIASSFADTDCDSDSDCETGSYVFSGNKCKPAARKLALQRTAPISIPQATNGPHSRSSFHYMESPVRHTELDDYESRDSADAMDINEDDLLLFGNLAYFRTQHGAKSGLEFRQRCSQQPTSTSSVEDEDIFDMEL